MTMKKSNSMQVHVPSQVGADAVDKSNKSSSKRQQDRNDSTYKPKSDNMDN